MNKKCICNSDAHSLRTQPFYAVNLFTSTNGVSSSSSPNDRLTHFVLTAYSPDKMAPVSIQLGQKILPTPFYSCTDLQSAKEKNLLKNKNITIIKIGMKFFLNVFWDGYQLHKNGKGHFYSGLFSVVYGNKYLYYHIHSFR